MSFIPPILRFFNVIPSNVLKASDFAQNQSKTTSIVFAILEYLKAIASNLNALENEKPTKVKFKETITQILGPTREEYFKTYGEGNNRSKLVGDLLWYTRQEKKAFLKAGEQDVKDYAGINDITSFREAKNLLFRSKDVIESTWINSQVTEKSIEIFKKFKKNRIDLTLINVQNPT